MTRGLGFPKLQSASTLIRTAHADVVVDSGALENADTIVQTLSTYGRGVEDIDILLITHSHFDHIENWNLFKNADLFIHWQEMEFIEKLLSCGDDEAAMDAVIDSHYVRILDYYVRAIKSRLRRNRSVYKNLVESKRPWYPLDGRSDITDGVSVVPTPGHTLGHMSVSVAGDSALGGLGTVWIGGDAITTREGWKNRAPHICADFELYAGTCEKIAQCGGVVVPGHDRPFDLDTLEYVSYESLNACHE